MIQRIRPSIPAFPVPRIAAEAARNRLAGFPILAITSPRQSVRTTFSRLIAPDPPYFSLEDPDPRALAIEDHRPFSATDPMEPFPTKSTALSGSSPASRASSISARFLIPPGH